MFINIKSQYANPEVQHIMSCCVYRRSLDAAISKLQQYRERPTYSLYGWVEQDVLLGICGFEVHQNNCVDVMHIAVLETSQKHGVGRKMLDALQNIFCLPLKLETDDDAVVFYQKCSFDVVALDIGGHRRYRCTRNVGLKK